MGTPIKELTVEGFKSIRKLDKFELRSLNVLIGANGAGKSNFVELFRMLRAMAVQNLQNYVLKAGGGDGLFFDGPKITPKIGASFVFGQNEYAFVLEPTVDGRVALSTESISYYGGTYPSTKIIGFGGQESQLKARKDDGGITGRTLAWPITSMVPCRLGLFIIFMTLVAFL